MHLITNDKQKAKIQAGNHVEKQKNDILEYIKQERSHVVYIEDKLVNPTDSLKQLGHVLTSSEVERRLRTVLPSSVAFINNPYQTDKKAIVRVISGDPIFGKYETLCAYERGVMPEHSILQLVEEDIPDPDIVARRKTLSRKDLPSVPYVPGQGYVYEGTQPGFIKNKKLGREIKRGWRTILIKLMLGKWLSVADAEKLFGQDQTTNWAYHTGRAQSIEVPW